MDAVVYTIPALVWRFHEVLHDGDGCESHEIISLHRFYALATIAVHLGAHFLGLFLIGTLLSLSLAIALFIFGYLRLESCQLGKQLLLLGPQLFLIMYSIRSKSS